jgi:hypothetical protein
MASLDYVHAGGHVVVFGNQDTWESVTSAAAWFAGRDRVARLPALTVEARNACTLPMSTSAKPHHGKFWRTRTRSHPRDDGRGKV